MSKAHSTAELIACCTAQLTQLNENLKHFELPGVVADEYVRNGKSFKIVKLNLEMAAARELLDRLESLVLTLFHLHSPALY